MIAPKQINNILNTKRSTERSAAIMRPNPKISIIPKQIDNILNTKISAEDDR